MLLYIQDQLDRVSTLAEDLKLLKENKMSGEARMCIVYRSEKKKIVRS